MFYPTFYGTRPDPFSMLRQMARAVEEPVRASFPPVNIWQGSDTIALTAELPGVDPDDIEISAEDRVLTISGEIKPYEQDEDAVWHRQERRYGKFVRTVRLPYRVDPDKVEARFVNGVLQIALHRPEEDKPRRIEVKAA